MSSPSLKNIFLIYLLVPETFLSDNRIRWGQSVNDTIKYAFNNKLARSNKLLVIGVIIIFWEEVWRLVLLGIRFDFDFLSFIRCEFCWNEVNLF